MQGRQSLESAWAVWVTGLSWHDRSRLLMLVPLELVVIMIPFMNAILRLSCTLVSFLVMEFASSVGGLPHIVIIPFILMMIALALWILSP